MTPPPTTPMEAPPLNLKAMSLFGSKEIVNEIVLFQFTDN